MRVNGVFGANEGNRDSLATRFINFDGKRINRNLVAQLAKNNPYSLTEPNQRAISNAISELGRVKGIKNIKFLMDTAAKNKYSTHIVLEDAPKNDWINKLITAALAAVSITQLMNPNVWIEKIMSAGKNKNLNNDEKHILKLRDNLLKSADLEKIKK